MFRFLSQEPYSSAIPWQSLHLFWVDERMVAFDDPRSNFGAAKEDFLDKVPLPPDHLHPMPTWAEPSEGASVYQAELKGFFQRFGEVDMPIFDLVFLGLGKDGHTASLFPGKDPALNPAEWVLSVKGGDPDVFRLTLNYHVLNRAKRVVFLVSGKEKASILKTIFEDKEARLPAQEIRPANGKLTWLLDQEAASLL
jgi:6-phosphogluconolactonase